MAAFDEYRDMAEAYYTGKVEEWKEIQVWAKRSITYTPLGIVQSMREEGTAPPEEVWGVSAELFQDTGKRTCIHVKKALYDLCESPNKEDPNYWLAHERAGNPHVYSHDADEDLETEE